MTEQQSPEQVARQRLQEQESGERQQKLNEFTKQEAERRRVEEEEAAAEKRRAEAEKRAEELAAKRAGLEEKIQEQVAAVNATLTELVETDAEHRRARRDAGAARHSLLDSPLSRSVDQFLESSFEGFLRAKPHARDRRSLAALDPLTSSSEPTGRAPAPGLPGSDPRDEPRRESARFLEALHQRAKMLRRQFARDLSLGELLGDGERDQYEELPEEGRETVQRMLSGSAS